MLLDQSSSKSTKQEVIDKSGGRNRRSRAQAHHVRSNRRRDRPVATRKCMSADFHFSKLGMEPSRAAREAGAAQQRSVTAKTNTKIGRTKYPAALENASFFSFYSMNGLWQLTPSRISTTLLLFILMPLHEQRNFQFPHTHRSL